MAGRGEPLVVAVVLNWNGLSIEHNGEPILKSCLRTLAKTRYKNLKIVVADSGSRDGSVRYVKQYFPGIDILRVKNRGFAYGNNVAIMHAAKKYRDLEYLVLLNDDLIFDGGGWLDELVRAAGSDKRIGIVGCRLRYPDGRIQHAGAHITPFGLPDNYKKDRESGYVRGVMGAVFLVKKEVFRRIGLLDEVYLPFLEEEIDFCERARRQGYETYYVRDVEITHLEGKSMFKTKMKNNWSPEEREYIFARNNFIFLLRWHKLLVVPNMLFRMVLPLFGGLVSSQLKRTRVNYRFSTVIPAFIEALSLYRQERIPRL